MRLVTFTESGRARPGCLAGQEVVDLSEAGPPSLLSWIEAGEDGLAAARRALDSAPRFALDDVRLEAPIARPPKILAVGLNYADHAAETGREPPEIPVIFNKQTTSVNGPFDPIERPRVSERLDYEGELGIVIGQRCRHVSRDRAPDVIAGYTVVDDVSVRDWQRRSPTMTMGKSFDTHCPFGPAIVTHDEIGDPHALGLETHVSGERRQCSNTRELIFDAFDLIEHLSTAFTLEPGDLISTGTCSGVGAAMDPPRWLVPGDVVRIEIEGIGAIENPVVDEEDS